MSIEATNWALGHMRREDLPSVTRFVLLILSNRADPEGLCWPSVAYIKRHTGYADSTIRDACKAIAERGLMKIEQQQRVDGGKGANRYLLRLDTPPPPPGGDTPPPPRGGAPRRHAGDPPPPGGGQYKTGTLDSTSLKGDGGAAKARPPTLNGKVVALIPIIGGTDWPVTETYLHELEQAYPAVDGKQTLQEIRAWCISNPTLRKTPRGVMRFINSWFRREQDAPARRL